MCKNKPIQKLTAILLSVILLVEIVPVTAMAQQLSESEIATWNEAEIESNMAQDNLAGSATVAKFMLSNLAAGGVSYVGGMGMEAAIGSIFGTPEDTTMIDGFNQMSTQIESLKNDIAKLSAKLDMLALKDNLDNFGIFMIDYAVVYKYLCGMQEAYENNSRLTDKFLQDLYYLEDKSTMIGGRNIINATIVLGERLTMSYTGNYNIFGAFDKMDKFTNRWEHQGYKQRQAFRDSAIYTYIMFSSMSQLACQAVITANPPKEGESIEAENRRVTATQLLKELKENVVKVNKMNERCAVIEHPELRIFRDTKKGEDLWYFHKQVQTSYVYQQNDPENAHASRYFRSQIYLFPMSRLENPRYVIETPSGHYYSNQPSVNMYQRIREYSISDNNGKNLPLYNIFFDDNKGDFDLPSGQSRLARFATHHYEIYPSKGSGHAMDTWRTTVVDNNASAANHVFAISDIVPFRSTEKFYSPIYYYGTVQQGKLMLPEEPSLSEPEDKISGMANQYTLPHAEPVTLTVDAKPGYTYQWYVITGDGNDFYELEGEVGTSYTLPALTASMNGYQYVCTFIDDSGTTPEEKITASDTESPGPVNGTDDLSPSDRYVSPLSTAAVTLHLSGEGVAVPETIHTVSSAGDLQTALDQVSAGKWDGHTLRLTSAIEYPYPITLLNRSLTIDLNGYTLNVRPMATTTPNVDPMSSTPEIAAVYASGSILTINNVTGSALNVIADTDIAYALYVTEGSTVQVSTVAAEGGIAAYASGSGSSIELSGDIRASGNQAVGAWSVDGASIRIGGDLAVAGADSYGAFVDSSNGTVAEITIDGSITVTGTNSRGVFLDSTNTKISVKGNVTVTGGNVGVSCGQGEVSITGNVTAPNNAVSARNGASVHVGGSILTTAKEAVGVSSFGANVQILGDVTASGSGSTAIEATTWELSGSSVGAQITVNGTITAVTPLRIGGNPKENDDNIEPTTKAGYLTFTGEGSSVWAKSNSFAEPTLYTLIVNADGGMASGEGQYAKNTEVSIGAGSRSGYSFSGWYSNNGGSFADQSSANTTFIMPASNAVVTASWSYIGGYTGSITDKSTTTPSPSILPQKKPNLPVTATAFIKAKAGKNGKASASIPNKSITDVIKKAQADAKTQDKTSNGITVELNVTMPKGASSLAVTLTQLSLNNLVSADISSIKINGAPATLGLDLNALQKIQKQSNGNITISIAPAKGLSKSAKVLIGNRPIYDITITYIDKNQKPRSISNLGSGTATLSIPYTPGKKESVGCLFGVYVDGKGIASRIGGSAYDANSGCILLNSNHLSVYGVGYTASSSKFTDISSHWAKESIDYVVGRELVSGISKTSFSPDSAMTRGVLVTALGRMMNVNTKLYTANSFTDVKADSAFRPYIEWAYKKGIIQDIGNSQFAPDGAITREEIAIIITGFARISGYNLPVSREATTYTDDSSIDSTYQTAVLTLQQAGILMGGTDHKFNPKDNATRAEVSSMLYRYIKLTVDPNTTQGWAQNDDGQYLYYKDGKALIGWQEISRGKDKNTYYFTNDGILVSNEWLQLDGKWYYFNADGSLAVSTKIDGYEVDENGVRITKS